MSRRTVFASLTALGKPGGPPLVFMNYFSGNLDDWDPQVTDGFAADYDVILFDNAGVGSSGGETPGTVSEILRGMPWRSATPLG